MMTNETIAETFERIADLLEITGANPFRVRAYRNAARAIRDVGESLADLAQSGPQKIEAIPGIGKDLANKCMELIRTGESQQLKELERQVPTSLLELLRVPGLGPKKAATLYHELGIRDLEELQAACEAGRVRALKGFGAKTESALLEGLAFAKTTRHRMRWADAEPRVEELLAHLRTVPGVEQLAAAGSYRRGKETIGDVDILAVADDPRAIMQKLSEYRHLDTELARGDTKMSVRLGDGLQVDLRVIPRASFGAALQYFTGSKEHNVHLRGLAKSRGLKVNEYGVFREENGQDRYVAGETEESVYAAMGLPWIPPELREAREEFSWAQEGRLPNLIELSDLQGDLHMHTVASDGQGTIEDMVKGARARGLSYIAITDHSQRVSMARGLDPARLREQWRTIDSWNQQLAPGFNILKGIECDILEGGGMDLPDDVLAEADWVLASVHYGQHQSRQQITDRLLGAIRHPHVTAIAHPTGRLINRRAPYEVDMEAIFQAAEEHGTWLELNANPYRLDLNELHCAMARRRGIPIVINSDAHQVVGLDVLRYGVLQARRGGLSAQDVANTRPWPEFQQLLAHKKWTRT